MQHEQECHITCVVVPQYGPHCGKDPSDMNLFLVLQLMMTVMKV